MSGERAKKFVLFGSSLEATVTVLGGRVDELHLDLLGVPRAGCREDGLAENNRSLARANDSTLNQEEVVVDLTVVREAAQRGDVLLNCIVVAGGIVLDTSLGASTNSEDLVVDHSSRVVTILTVAGHSRLDGSWMPSTDTADLSQTSVSLTRQALGAETLDQALETVTSGNTNGVDNVVVSEDLANLDLLLELAVGKVDLLGGVTTVNLDLQDVGLVLAELQETDLGGNENTDDRAVLLDAFKVALDGAGALGVLLESVSVLAERLLLGIGPVSVEAALDISVEVLGPDGVELAETAWSLNVADETDNLDGWAFDDSGGQNDVFLEDFLSFTTLVVLDYVGHAGLVTNESSEVAWLGLVVLGPVLAATSVVLRASLWHEAERTVSWVLELAVRHLFNK